MIAKQVESYRRRGPAFRIWVEGRPQSAQKHGSVANYTDRIREAARKVVPNPTESSRLDIEIWFEAGSFNRPDVDNIIKPVLDALIGVVYADDRQVRSVRAVALPNDDVIRTSGWVEQGVVERFRKEFLINVFAGADLARDGP